MWMKLAQDLAFGVCYQITVFWDVTTCGVVDNYQLTAVIFGVEDTFTLKMAAGTYIPVHGATSQKIVIQLLTAMIITILMFILVLVKLN